MLRLRDFRFAWRTLAKSPGFALTAIAALALGVGANTAIFSLVNQLLLNPPGISNPDRIVAVRAKYDKLSLKSIPLSAPDFADVRNATQVFARAAMMSEGEDFNYTGGEAPERLQGASVSVQWFEVFGVRPFLGRTFQPEEDLPGASPVVVLSYATWKRLYGGNPSVLGQAIELNQKPYRIIGVMGPEFRWPRLVDVWAPAGLGADAFREQNRFNESYFSVALMKPGVSLPQANSLIQVLADRVRNNGTGSGAYAKTSLWGMFAVPMTDFIAGDTKKPMLVLLGAVGFVLLIACANIAGLMVARTSGRSREIAVRAALGAGRGQLIGQVISESLLLASAGAVAGLAVAYAGMRLLLALAPENAAVGLDARLDISVLLFTGAVAILSGILFGLAPAWQIAQIDPYEILKTSGRSATTGHGRQRLRAGLVVCEAALAVVLLAGAGLFLRSLTRLQDVRPGFEPRGVMTATLSLPPAQYKEPEKQIVFYRSVLERLSGVRGVTAAAAGIPLPFSGNNGSASFNIEGRTAGPGDPGPHGDVRYVTPGYFEAMGIPLKSGRYFGSEDRRGTEPVVVIDENLARQYWPNENPIGRHIRRNLRAAPWSSIVGVVGHVNHSDLAGDTGKGVYYYCTFQQPVPFHSLVVKTQGDPSSLAAAIRQAVREVDPNQPVHHLKTMEDMVAGSLAPRKFVVRLLGFFALVALFMAALGLYGVISYSVTQRTQEIGIRMALGAQSGSLLSMVIGQGLRLAGIGVAAGLAMAFVCSRLLQNQFFGVSAMDPITFVSISAVLLGAAFLASYIPARRATRVDPLESLRYE
jgi:predicted permease